MRYAQVRLFIISGLRTNGALFGCASWNGYAHSWPSKWVVQSPGVINNRDEQRTAANTFFFVSYQLLIYRGCDRVSFILLVVHRGMAHWLCPMAINITIGESVKLTEARFGPSDLRYAAVYLSVWL